MSSDELLELISDALCSVRDPIHYREGRERSFQAALYAELQRRLPSAFVSDGGLFEQELQKSASEHGITYRPDLVLHIPFERGLTSSRKEGNHVAIELKVRASQGEAGEDYTKLGIMCERLSYPLGVFINIDAADPLRHVYGGPHQEKLFGFAVQLDKGQVRVVGPCGLVRCDLVEK